MNTEQQTTLAEIAVLQALGYSPALVKAASDHYDYALKLKNGEIIRFSKCIPNGTWVTLFGMDEHEQIQKLPYHFPDRGLEVRLSDIIWCADAPEGS